MLKSSCKQYKTVPDRRRNQAISCWWSFGTEYLIQPFRYIGVFWN